MIQTKMSSEHRREARLEQGGDVKPNILTSSDFLQDVASYKEYGTKILITQQVGQQRTLLESTLIRDLPRRQMYMSQLRPPTLAGPS